jgi:hypothetical protein
MFQLISYSSYIAALTWAGFEIYSFTAPILQSVSTMAP